MSVQLSTLFESAVNYIEEHIYEPLSDSDVAAGISMPESVFRGFFTSATGMTPGEYIKNRRMSLAGQEALLSDMKIIDLAYRYGYETPESFTKAFTRYHGISPLKARKSGGGCKAFAPLSVQLSVEGGPFSCEVVRNGGYELLAKTTYFSKLTAREEAEEIRTFWSACVEDGTIERLRGTDKNDGEKSTQLFSFRIPVSNRLVKYGIGIACESTKNAETRFNSKEMAELERIRFPHSVWAVFSCEGKNEESIEKMKRLIRQLYLPSCAFGNAAGDGAYLYEQGCRMHEYFGKMLIPVKYSDKCGSETGGAGAAPEPGTAECRTAERVSSGYSTSEYGGTVCGSAEQGSAAQRSAVQRSAVQRRAEQGSAVLRRAEQGSSVSGSSKHGGSGFKFEHNKGSIKTVHLRGRDIGSRLLWEILLHLAKGLEDDKLWYHIDGKSLIFAHGIDIPIERIGVTFPWRDESRVRRFFGPAGLKTVDYSFSQFKYFDAQFEGFPVRCMFYGGDGLIQTKEEFQKNAEPVLVSGQLIMVQKLEFYMRYAEDEELIAKIKDYLINQDSE